jgi:hypothetical protein
MTAERTQPLIVAALLLLAAPRTTRAQTIGVPEGGETGHPVHVTLDAAATYGIGGYSALGAQLHAVGQLPVWNTGFATGTFDFGVVLGWQDEPEALQYAVPPTQDNDAQRLNAWVTAGHSFHMGQRRRATLGVHLFAGWTHVWSWATVVDERLDLDASASDDYGLFNAGALVKFDYRFSEWIGCHVQAAAPFGVGSSYVTTLFHVGIGLTAYLR